MNQRGFYVPDRRTDDHGNVTVTFGIAEFEAFLGVLNRGNLWVREDTGQGYEGPRTLLKFLPRYAGGGVAAIEVRQAIIDDCRDGWVCSVHPFDPPGHGDCHEPRMACEDARHTREFEPAPEE